MRKIESQTFHLAGGEVVSVAGWANVPDAPNPGGDSRVFIPKFSNGKSMRLLVSDATLTLDLSGAYQGKLIQCIEGWLLQENPPEELACYE